MERWYSIAYLAVMFLAFYVFLIRPQKKHKQERQRLLSELKVNSQVITAGGIYGTITRIKDDTVWLKIADKVEIQILKSSVHSHQNMEKK